MTMAADIRTSPKKVRKPQARSLPLREAITRVANEYDRMSVRQLFYQLVSRGAIEKTEQDYKRVCDFSAQMRLDGSLSYRKIVDGHRSRRIPWTFDSLSEALENTYELYRRNYWLEQSTAVEIWCEKDALTGVIQPTCDRYGVTYVATRGFPSITLVYESAVTMRESGKHTVIYYFGDHDPSGRAIHANLERDMRDHGADVTVKRIGLEPQHIRNYNLPTRPSKKSDSRYANFAEQYGDASVELDALPPNILVHWVEDSIIQHIDTNVWSKAMQVEELEKETLLSLAQAGWKAGHVYKIGNDPDDEDEGGAA